MQKDPYVKTDFRLDLNIWFFRRIVKNTFWLWIMCGV